MVAVTRIQSVTAVVFPLSASTVGGQSLPDLPHSLCISHLVPSTHNLILKHICKGNCKHFLRHSLVVQGRSILCVNAQIHPSPDSLIIKGRNAEFPEGALGPLMLLLENLEIWMSKYINGTNKSPGASTGDKFSEQLGKEIPKTGGKRAMHLMKQMHCSMSSNLPHTHRNPWPWFIAEANEINLLGLHNMRPEITFEC